MSSAARRTGRPGAFATGLLTIALAAVLAIAAPSAQAVVASPPATWSGADTANSHLWNDTNNWQAGTGPTTQTTSLTFPSMTCSSDSADPCLSENNIGAVGTGTLTIDDTTPYEIVSSGGASGLTLASGGLQTTANNCSSANGAGAYIQLPITLSISQSWSILGCPSDSATPGSLDIPDVSGPPTDPLSIALNGQLTTTQFDVGTLTFSGTGEVNLYSSNGPGSLNGNSDQQVSFSGGAGLSVGSYGANTATAGPLSMTGGSLDVGAGAPVILNVGGAASFGGNDSYSSVIDQAGMTAGTDYSQLNASGLLTLNGSSLSLNGSDPNSGNCPTLHVGDTDTILHGTTLSGTFSNAPDGSTMPINCNGGGGTAPTVQINYTSNAVTATVVTAGSSLEGTTTTLSHSPQNPAAGQATTLTATVAGNDGSTPPGTVSFTDNGNQISGCGGQAVDPNTGKATCQASFGSGTHNLVATYTPESGAYYSGSSGNDTVTAPSPPASSPSATTNGANPIGTTTATLNGLIDTKGQVVTWQFQYGESTTYNKATPIQTIAAGHNAPVPVAWKLVNLNPLTVYHFRLVAITQPGSGQTPLTGYGQDLTFTTKSTGSLLLGFSTLKLSGNTVSVPLKCSSKLKCSGRFSITTKSKVGKKKKLASVLCNTTFFTIKAGKTTKVKAKIYGACITLLRHAKGHRIKAQFTSRPRTGQFGLIKNITLIL